MRIIIFFLFTAFFFACKNDAPDTETVRQAAKETAIEESTPEMLAHASAEGKIVSVTKEKITLDNTKEIVLPAEGDTAATTIYLVQAAEKMEGKTALAEAGLARAGYLASLLQNAGINQAYTDGNNASMQTATLSARANECDLNFFKPENSQMMVSTIMQNFKGKKVLVVGTPETLSMMLGILADNPKLKVPGTEFDNFFVVRAKSDGKAELNHVMY